MKERYDKSWAYRLHLFRNIYWYLAFFSNDHIQANIEPRAFRFDTLVARLNLRIFISVDEHFPKPALFFSGYSIHYLAGQELLRRPKEISFFYRSIGPEVISPAL